MATAAIVQAMPDETETGEERRDCGGNAEHLRVAQQREVPAFNVLVEEVAVHRPIAAGLAPPCVMSGPQVMPSSFAGMSVAA